MVNFQDKLNAFFLFWLKYYFLSSVVARSQSSVLELHSRWGLQRTEASCRSLQGRESQLLLPTYSRSRAVSWAVADPCTLLLIYCTLAYCVPVWIRHLHYFEGVDRMCLLLLSLAWPYISGLVSFPPLEGASERLSLRQSASSHGVSAALQGREESSWIHPTLGGLGLNRKETRRWFCLQGGPGNPGPQWEQGGGPDAPLFWPRK